MARSSPASTFSSLDASSVGSPLHVSILSLRWNFKNLQMEDRINKIIFDKFSLKLIQHFRVGTWRNTRLADCPKNRFHQLLHWCLLRLSYMHWQLQRLSWTILPFKGDKAWQAKIIQNNSRIYFKGDNVQLPACNICRSPFRSSRARTLSRASGSLPCSLGNHICL